ncbi:MAG: hypothetical protein ACYC2T_08590 [Bacillota bacterium]
MLVVANAGIMLMVMFFAAVVFAVIYDYHSYSQLRLEKGKDEDDVLGNTIDGTIDEALFTIFLLFVLIIMFAIMLPTTLVKILFVGVLIVYLVRLIYAFIRDTQMEAQLKEAGRNIRQD